MVIAFGARNAGDVSPLYGADWKYPLAVAVADGGPVYVADLRLPGIWKLEDGRATVYFQGSEQFRTPLNAVRCLAIDPQGRLLAGDTATREVYRFNDEGKPEPLTEGKVGIGIPMAIAVHPEDGTLYVADLETHRIWKLPEEGGHPEEFAQVPAPRGLTFGRDGNLWVVSHGPNQVLRLSPEGKTEPIVKGRPFQFPHHIVLDEQNVAYVTDGYAKAIWKLGDSRKPVKWIHGDPLANPVGLARRGKTLLVADPHAKALFAVGADGQLETLVQAERRN